MKTLRQWLSGFLLLLAAGSLSAQAAPESYSFTLQQRKPDLTLMRDLADIEETSEPCPGGVESVRSWYGLRDRDGLFVRDFQTCYNDVRKIGERGRVSRMTAGGETRIANMNRRGIRADKDHVLDLLCAPSVVLE